VSRRDWMWFGSLPSAPRAEDHDDDRCASQTEPKWQLITAVAQEGVRNLQGPAAAMPDPSQPVSIRVRGAHLGGVERFVSETFFTDSIEVAPWSESLIDGRHSAWEL